LKIPIDHTDKESKNYTTKVKIYDSGPPEEFLKWRLILSEQIKNNGYEDNTDNWMNLAQAMLAGRSLEAFMNEKSMQEAKNRVCKAKTTTEHTPRKYLISRYSNYQFECFTSKLDGAMPTRGRKST
jgi:hypothetical protein